MAEISADGWSYHFLPADGRPGVFVPYDTIPDWTWDEVAGDDDDSADGARELAEESDALCQPLEDWSRPALSDLEPLPNRKVLILDNTDALADQPTSALDNGTYFAWLQERDAVLEQIEELGFDVTHRVLYDNLQLTDYLDLAEYGIVISLGHGSYKVSGYPGLALYFDWSEAEANPDWLACDAGFGPSAFPQCELVEVRSGGGDSWMLVSHRFFENHLGALPGSLVVLFHCFTKGMPAVSTTPSGLDVYESQLPAVFVGKGAHTIFGNTGLGQADSFPHQLLRLFQGLGAAGMDAQASLYSLSSALRFGHVRSDFPHACTESYREHPRRLALTSETTFDVTGLDDLATATVRIQAADDAPESLPDLPPLATVFEMGLDELDWTVEVAGPWDELDPVEIPVLPWGYEIVATSDEASGELVSQVTATLEDDEEEVSLPFGGRVAFRGPTGALFVRPIVPGGSLGGDEDDLRVQLAGDGAYPSVSPDGEWIAYQSSASGAPEIWKVRVDGTEATQLTFAGVSQASYHPAWSPDGAQIAFTQRRRTWSGDLVVQYHLKVMDADGSGEAYVTSGNFTDVTEYWGFFGDWSPDGSQLAFTVGTPVDGFPGEIGSYDLALIDASARDVDLNATEGTSWTRLAGNGLDARPRWSPDGARLAYHRITQSPLPGSWPLQTSEDGFVRVREVASGADVECAAGNEAAWSSDGAHLVWTRLPVAADVGLWQVAWDGASCGTPLRMTELADSEVDW